MGKHFRGLALVALGAYMGTAVASPPAVSPAPQRVRVGVALGGGSYAGLAHVGVLQWLFAHQVPVDALAGTSIGALVGGIFAAGNSPADLERILRQIDLRDIFAVRPDYQRLSLRRREDRERSPVSFKVGLRHGVKLERSVAEPNALNALLDRVFLNFGNSTDFESLPVPFRCVATDLVSGDAVTLSKGSLPLALRASSALPGIFPPVSLDGREFVDGALLENIPVDVVRAMRVDRLIAVQLPARPWDSSAISLISTLERAVSVTISANERRSLEHADIRITPDVANISLDDPDPVSEYIRAGWNAAEGQSAALLPLRLADSEWRAYLQSLRDRLRPPEPPPAFIEAKGGNKAVQEAAVKALAPSVGVPVSPDRIETELDQIRGSQRWVATYGSEVRDGQPGLLVHLGDSPTGPPFLLLGADLLAQSSDVTRINLKSQFVWQGLGGYGSELRVNSTLGFETDLSAEYYYKLGLSRFFLAPRATANRDPVYLYHDQDRLAERLDRRAGGGFDAGIAISPRSELRVGWDGESIAWIPQFGADPNGRISGPVQRFAVHYAYFGQDDAGLATKGFTVRADAGYLLPGPLENGAPYGKLHAAEFLPLSDKNFVVFGFTGASYFGRTVADPLRFAIGGPFDFSSAAVGEFRANGFILAQPAYLRQVANLPSFLGGRLFAVVAYEAARVSNVDQPAIFRQDGLAGVVGETPIGPVGFGVSIGDAGHHKVFVSIGRAFGQ